MLRTATALAGLLAVLLAAGGSAAAGSQVVVSHQGDAAPTGEGFAVRPVGDVFEALNHVLPSGIADDLGLPVWAVDDGTALAGGEYAAALTAGERTNALAAGFTLRARLRIVPQESLLPTNPGVARVMVDADGHDFEIRFGANAAPPGGDGGLRLLFGGSEVALAGGPVHHALDLVYDPPTDSADLFADGMEVISDVPAGLASSVYQEAGFGTTLAGTGEVRVNLFELEIQLADCDDGLDNDGDGLTDLADPGCDEAGDLDESDTFACNDGADDDGDGLTDLADPGCATRTDEIEFDLAGAGNAWNAELRLRFEPGLGFGYPDSEIVAAGVVRVGGGPGGVPYLQLPAVSGTVNAALSTPVGLVDGYRVDASLAPGALAVSTALPANTHPLRGEVRLCLMLDPSCDLAFSSEPLSSTRGFGVVGVGGGTSYGTGTVLVDELFRPWTLGTASTQVSTSSGATALLTRQGFAHGPASATSSFSQTSGVVQWVTATRVDYSGDISADSGTFTSLRVRLLPEPGRFALLAAGAAALLALGRRRLR